MTIKSKKKVSDYILLGVLCTLVVAIVTFCIFKWYLIVSLFDYLIKGKNILREYILSFGIWGVIAISLLIVFCFFFPIISSLPLQIIALFTYGIWGGTLLIALSFTFGSQLLYLFQHNFKAFMYTAKQRKKQADIEARIQNSSRNIYGVMFWLYIIPCIPFLIIASVALRSNMKWWKYTLFTSLGPVPEILVTLLLGNQLINAGSPVWSFMILIGMLALVVLSFVFQDKMIYWVFKPKKTVSTNNTATPTTDENQNATEQPDAH